MLLRRRWSVMGARGRLSKWSYQIRDVVTNSTSAGESSGGPESIKFKTYTDPDERRGYKFDGSLDLTALIDRSSAMGFINTSDADGFRAKNLRTGGEPPDPEKAKEIMVFFKNRQKPPKQANTANLRSILQSSKDSILGHAKEVRAQTLHQVTSSFLNQRTKLPLDVRTDGDALRASSGRIISRATVSASQQQNDQPASTQMKVLAPTNLHHFNKSIGRKTAQSGSNQASNPPPRGSYKMSKPSKKQ